MEQIEFYARNISMDFPGVRALDGVSIKIHGGEIRAVAGANGAGKSTLMKVLSGVYPSYGGDIFYNGRRYKLDSPMEAKKLGIHTVYQEVDTALFPDFAVYENLLFDDLAEETGRGRTVVYNRKKYKQKAEEILAGLGIELAVCAQVKTLTLAQKQLLLIAKEVHKKCRLLILDEPTAALGRNETQKLFRLIKRLAEKQNTAVLFITHRIAEIISICSCCSVLCAGRLTDEFAITADTKINMITEKMLGGHENTLSESETLRERTGRAESHTDSVLLEAEGLCDRAGRVKQVSFQVRKGEIVGLAGLAGAGKSGLCRLLFGAEKRGAGTLRLHGKEIILNHPSDAVKQKIALIPEERRKEGIFPLESTAFNLCAACLEKFCTGPFLRKQKMERYGKEAVKKFGISCRDEKQQVLFLSGGNQQKVVIGKWIKADCDVYLFDEPMQGIDMGARQEILQIIFQLAQHGAAVIYASSDISELIAAADRIYVMYNGRIIGEFSAEETEEKEIMYAAAGGKIEE